VHCGQWLHAGAAGVLMGPPQPGMGPHEGAFSDGSEEPEEDCPWEDRGSYGTLNAFFQTATKCLLTPTAFFSTLPRRGGFLNPILFGVMSVVASFVLAYIWYSLLKGGGGGLFVFLIGIPFVVLGAFMLVPIGLFLGSGILHLCLLLVGGANEGYQATFRVASYSSVTSLFNAIPVLGAIASLWGIVLTVIGLREVHKTSTGKSVAAVLIPVGLAILLAVGAIAMGAFAVTNWAMRPLSQSARSQTPQTDVCSALEDYIVKMDALKDEDPKEIPAQARQALTELEKVLKQSRGGGNVGRVRQFGRALFARTVAPTQVEEKILGFQAGLSQLDDALRKEREALLQICGK
jgi:hypothetical protein